MSPAEMRMLIDVCTIPRTVLHPDKARYLLDKDLIQADLGDNTWAPTYRGNAMLEMLIATPLPERMWVDPRTNKVVKR